MIINKSGGHNQHKKNGAYSEMPNKSEKLNSKFKFE